MTRRALRSAALGLVAGLVGLAGCGIGAQDEARRIEPDAVPFGLLDPDVTTTSIAAGREVTVYLRSEDRLVPVQRTVPTDAGLADLVQALVDGPTASERTLGITSSVPAGAVASVTQGRGIAEVDLTADFGDIRSAEQLYALAEVVYTLTGQPGIGSVRFTLEGEEVLVPLADGTATRDPLARDDLPDLEPA